MSLGRDLWRLSIPMIVGQLAFASMSFIDTVLMGQLGVEALAGGGLGSVAFQFFYVVSVGVLTATANHIAVAKGRGDDKEIHRALLSGVWIVAVLTLLFGLAIWFIRPVFLLLGQDEGVSLIAEQYLHTLVWALFPALLFILFRSLVLGVGNPGVVLPISVVAAALNYPISYTLMTGQFGLPAMGIEGVAWGTFTVSCGMAVAIIVSSYRQPRFKGYPFWSGWEDFSFKQFLDTWRLGIPIALAHAMEIGMFSAAALLIGLVGVDALAAHQVALQCTTLAFMIPLGLSQAISVKVGEFYGAGRYNDVRRTVRYGLLAATFAALVSGSLFIFAPEQLTHFFVEGERTSLEALIPVAVSLLFVAAMFQLVDGWQVVLMGVLRGFRLGASPTIAATVSYWAIGFPLSYILMKSYGAVGVWTGMGVGLATSALILAALYQRFTMKNLLES